VIQRLLGILCCTLFVVASVIAFPPKGGDAQMSEEFQRIATRVASMRGEKFDPPVSAARVPDDLRQIATEIRAMAVLDRSRLAARGRAWVDLGLADSVEAPRRLIETLAADIRGVGLDPDGSRLFIGPELLRPEDFEPSGEEGDPSTILMMTGMRRDAPVIAHALMHLRQRQRDGRDFLDPETDRLLAGAAWSEGEANFLAVRHLFAGMRLDEEAMALVRSPAEVLEGMLLAPPSSSYSPAERGLLEFIYLDGYERVAELHRSGGWDAVMSRRKSHTRTRDLMHAEREPLPAAPPKIEAVSPGEGWELADEDTLGERASAMLIAVITGKESSALRVADGWRHDRVLRWERGTGGGITEWISEWMATPDQPEPSAEKSAADFAGALAKAFQLRFPEREPTQVEEGVVTLLTAERLVRIELRGSRVRLEIRALNG